MRHNLCYETENGRESPNRIITQRNSDLIKTWIAISILLLFLIYISYKLVQFYQKEQMILSRLSLCSCTAFFDRKFRSSHNLNDQTIDTLFNSNLIQNKLRSTKQKQFSEQLPYLKSLDVFITSLLIMLNSFNFVYLSCGEVAHSLNLILCSAHLILCR